MPEEWASSVGPHLEVDTAGGRLTDRAVSAGAEPLSAPADTPYGARQSMLRDPFGHVWFFPMPVAA